MKKRAIDKYGALLFWILLWPGLLQAQSGSSQDGEVSIFSNVIGANIYCDSVYIGVTPLPNVSLHPGKHALTVIDGTPLQWNAKWKEQEIEIIAGSTAVVYCDFTVDSAQNVISRAALQSDILVSPRDVEFHPLLVVGTGVSFICGIATAYFKTKADRYYDTFLTTGDDASLQKTHRFDTIAAVTLTLSQIGLAIIAYCLLSE